MALDLSPWITVTPSIRVRGNRNGAGGVAVVNNGAGGWDIHVTSGSEDYRASVPGVVTWREAERCATRYLRRKIRERRKVDAS